jgi:hypothetical protein
MSPTQRSLKYLRALGFDVAVTERWNPYAKIRQDLFGWMDLLAYHPGDKTTRGIQVTSASNMAARVTKLRASKYATRWHQAGNVVVVHGWAKRARKGKRVKYELLSRIISEFA